MSEGIKTGIFWIAAVAVAAVAAVVTWQPASDTSVATRIGKPLFEEFTDPLAATSMRIVTFNETLGELDTFEVAKDKQTGVWNIPSRQGYPADAASQMEAAANALLNLKILDVKSDSPEMHEQFGVVEPDIEKLMVGDSGVGRLVTVRSADGETLASLIIGDEVEGVPSHHYVRIPNQDPVYEVALDDSALTTRFRQWIEDDLLRLSSFDIAGVKIRNYSATLGVSVQTQSFVTDINRDYDANLAIDQETNQWNLDSLVVYDETNSGQVRSLEEGETLNAPRLNEMKRALDDLAIADVVRKPEGMSADLKANNELVTNQESMASLVQRGFYPSRGSTGEIEILSANGEIVVDQRDGVQYVLRFGGISGIEEEDNEAAEGEGEEGEETEDIGGTNRYLLVTARVNQAMIPPPDVQAVPQSVEELEALLNPSSDSAPVEGQVQQNPNVEIAEDEPATSEASVGEEPADEEPADEAPAGEPADAQPEGDQEDPAAEQEPAVEETGEGEGQAEGTGTLTGSGALAQPPSDAEEDPEAAQDEAAEDAESAEASVDEEAAEDENAAQSESDAEGDATTEESSAEDAAAPEMRAPQNALAGLTDQEKQELLEAEQEKIIKENQRKRDEWKEKIEQANSRVRELNSRFADWYYIIPESTYTQLQIRLDDLIQTDAAGSTPNAETGADATTLPQFNFGQ